MINYAYIVRPMHNYDYYYISHNVLLFSTVNIINVNCTNATTLVFVYNFIRTSQLTMINRLIKVLLLRTCVCVLFFSLITLE